MLRLQLHTVTSAPEKLISDNAITTVVLILILILATRTITITIKIMIVRIIRRRRIITMTTQS